jgi:hypothetical protein
MGNEARCTMTWGEKRGEGKALLETTELIFRGEPRLKIPFSDMKSVKAAAGQLEVRFSGGTAKFALGEQAGKWAAKIKNPKSRIDKLDIKPGAKVAVIGVSDEKLLDELAARGADATTKLRAGCDAIFFGADRREQLARLDSLQENLAPAGGIWVIRPTGAAAIGEKDVFAAGRGAGLVDTKVVAFSETHSAQKFVIPVVKRKR